jgi:uncharacterized protein (TIGR04255 family)
MIFDKPIKLPKKISPCPIAEAIVELRFDAKVPSEALMGIVYERFKEKYPGFEPLPIMRLPLDLINSLPNLNYAPHYKFTNQNYILQLGPKCFSIVCPKDYTGWDKFAEEIKWVFGQIKNLKIIEKPLSLGVRYINFFERVDIFEKIKIDLSLAENSLVKNVNTLQTEFKYDNFQCVIRITNHSYLKGVTKGSTIDIDLISDQNLNSLDFENIVFSAHELEKKCFFGILTEEFLSQFNPEYDHE